MELAFVVYLISILETVKEYVFAVAMISAIIAAVWLFIKLMLNIDSFATDKQKAYPKKSLAALITISVLAFLVHALMPSEKAAYIILASYAGQRLAENSNVQQIGSKVLTVINQRLDEAIKEKK